MKRLKNHLIITGVILCSIFFLPKVIGAAAMPAKAGKATPWQLRSRAMREAFESEKTEGTLSDEVENLIMGYVSPSGRGKYEGSIAVWGPTKNNLVSLPGISCFAVSHDGKYIAAGFLNGSVKVLETAKWTEVFRKDSEPVEAQAAEAAAALPSNKVYSIAFSPHDLYLAYGFNDGTVEVLNAIDNVEEELKVEKKQPRAWKKAGRWTERYRFIKELEEGADPEQRLTVRSITFSTNDDLLACGFQDGIIKIWKMGNGKQEQILKDHLSPICALAFSPDNKFLASRGTNKGDSLLIHAPIRIWNIDSWNVERLIPTNEGHALIFSPDGNYLIFGSGQRVVKYRVSDWESMGLLEVPLVFARQMAFSLDGRYLALVDLGGDVLVCEDYRYNLLFKIPNYHFEGGVFFSPDENYLAVCVKDGIYLDRLVAFSLDQYAYSRENSEAYKIYSAYLGLVIKKYNNQYPREKIKGNDQVEFLTWKALIQHNNQAKNYLKKILKNAPLDEGSIPSDKTLIEAADLLKKSEKRIEPTRRYMTAVLGGFAAVVLIHQINARIRGNSKKTTIADVLAFMAQVAALRKAYKYLVEEDDYHRWKMAANSDPGGYFTGLANAFSEFAQQFYEQQMAKQAGEKRVRAGGLPPPVELP